VSLYNAFAHFFGGRDLSTTNATRKRKKRKIRRTGEWQSRKGEGKRGTVKKNTWWVFLREEIYEALDNYKNPSGLLAGFSVVALVVDYPNTPKGAPKRLFEFVRLTRICVLLA